MLAHSASPGRSLSMANLHQRAALYTKCFSSPTHIKDKYDTGYEMEVKIRTLSEAKSKVDIGKIESYLPLTWPNIKSYL